MGRLGKLEGGVLGEETIANEIAHPPIFPAVPIHVPLPRKDINNDLNKTNTPQQHKWVERIMRGKSRNWPFPGKRASPTAQLSVLDVFLWSTPSFCLPICLRLRENGRPQTKWKATARFVFMRLQYSANVTFCWKTTRRKNCAVEKTSS